MELHISFNIVICEYEELHKFLAQRSATSKHCHETDGPQFLRPWQQQGKAPRTFF